MKLLFVNDSDVHLGCLEMDGDSVTIKKYKDEFNPKIVDAKDEDDNDDIAASDMENAGDKEGKMSKMFAMKKPIKDDEDDEEQDVKKGKPMKQRRPGLF